jgi:hypothetical protein
LPRDPGIATTSGKLWRSWALLLVAAVLVAPAGCAKDQARWGAPVAAASPVAGSATPSPSSPPAAASPSAGAAPSQPVGCAILPPDNVWHADVSRLPVLAQSGAYVASIGAVKPVHPDFGAGRLDGAPFGIPVTTIRPDQARVPVRFEYAGESDPGPYPIPANALIEGGPNADGDRHVILYDPAGCKLYELYDAHPQGNGWAAGSGAVYDLRSNRLRRAGATSADAAGLPILPGLVRYDEVKAGHIDHAIRITAPQTRNAYAWPARHAASTRTDANLPPMGLRLRLKAGVDISRLPGPARVIAEALKRYGAILADNGSAWYLSGTQDDRWDNDALNALKSLRGDQFEAVDESGLMVNADSGQIRQ